jgi:hypothetical protein
MNESTVVLLSVGLALIVGWVCGNEVRRHKSAEAKVEGVRQHLQQASSITHTPERQLKQILGVLNDTHKQILAVSKALKKPAR